jgi:hypothetical protein
MGAALATTLAWFSVTWGTVGAADGGVWLAAAMVGLAESRVDVAGTVAEGVGTGVGVAGTMVDDVATGLGFGSTAGAFADMGGGPDGAAI